MILIISDNDDYSTNDVIDWLIYKNKIFCRINRDDLFELESLELNSDKDDFVVFDLKRKVNIRYTNLTAYWYRRGYLNLNFKYKIKKNKNEVVDYLFYQTLNSYLLKENEVVINCLYELLHKINGFGKYHENETNKLNNLIVAKSVGLKIPASIVSKHKETIFKFHEKLNDNLITKSLNQSGGLFWGNQTLYGLTQLVSIDEINEMETNGFSFLQKRIIKLFEIRIFYLERKIFAAAIFSQRNNKTNVDFRNYDGSNPNRVVPYNLPSEIEWRIIQFMEKIEMKSGSIDLVVDENNEYVFLEVNPIGQFAQISIPCNYFIEEYIANYLINEKN